jgi:hypothetical protein
MLEYYHGENMKVLEKLRPQGKVEVFVTKGTPRVTPGKLLQSAPVKIYDSAQIDFFGTQILRTETLKNIVLNAGKDRVVESLTTGLFRTIARMAMGDRGTIPSDPTIPKVPVETMSALYSEVYRADMDVTTLNIGTPSVHEATFIKTFSALLVPLASFSDQANPVINEVALIMADLFAGDPLPRAPVAAPAAPPADEELFAIRTFKSVPFEAANDISVTIRYTIFLE